MTNITNPNKIELMAKTEETKYKALKLSIAKVDMECAELIKKLRATPLFALELIRERIALMIGKYFSTPNQDLIYKIKSGTVEISAGTKIVRHDALKSDTLEPNNGYNPYES